MNRYGYSFWYIVLSVVWVLAVGTQAYAQNQNHNVSLDGGKILVLDSESTPIELDVKWLKDELPSSGKLKLSASGGEKVDIIDGGGKVLALPMEWADKATYPKSLKVKPKVVSDQKNDVKISIQHDSGPQRTIELTVIEIKLKSVSLTSDTDENSIVLKSDDLGVTYDKVHWEDKSVPLNGNATDPGDIKYPVAFIRATSPKMTAVFEVKPSDVTTGDGSYTVEAAGSKGSGFVVKAGTTADLSSGKLTMTARPSDGTLVNTVKYYPEEAITWKVAVNGGKSVGVGASTHRVYVVAGKPETPIRQESLFYIGCANGANGMADPDDTKLTQKIWEKFETKKVYRVKADGGDGAKLTYYADYRCGNLHTEDLLEFGDGQCGAWVELFLDARKVHGIVDPGNNRATIKPLSTNEGGFLVKDWSYSVPGTGALLGYSYKNRYKKALVKVGELSVEAYLESTWYSWISADVSDLSGVDGQGNADPASLFGNHQTAFLGNKYYDVSYGVIYPNLGKFEDSLAGFFRRTEGVLDEPVAGMDLNDDGDMDDLGVKVWVFNIRKPSVGDDVDASWVHY